MKNRDQYDVIIVGTGSTGLYCALQLPENLNLLIITKDAIENSDSFLAQGGISTLKNPEDYESFFEDTMRAGHYENRKESVEIMIKSSPEIINDLIAFGVDFDSTTEGWSYTREGAHSTYRILHHQDITGKEITGKLLKRVEEKSNISILEYTTMLDIIEEDKACTGIIVERKDKTIQGIYGKVVVWATGGIGGLFENSTNFSHLTGDSIAISLQHNIELENINYIQIHPTTLYSKKKGRRFLVSESVRGEGAILLNSRNERFVDELSPRDVVSEAIREQMLQFNSDFVYLSIANMGYHNFIKRFPNIYKRCLEEGYDIKNDNMIPVTPAQHYFMGGVKVDKESKTTLKNLYAIGETSCNGVHGANRLASNSLLEGLVFAKRAAFSIERIIKYIPFPTHNIDIFNIKYENNKAREERNKKIVLEEIKRKDENFYAKWGNNAN